MDACPSDLEWTRWLSGDLPEDQRARVLAHLDGCADCRAVCAALAPAAPPSTSSAGSERYVLGEQIARGGMGRILRADDRVLGRAVALKIPHQQAGAQARFAREIAILARLSHPSIVTVLDAGQLDADTPFFAMPFLAGRTLAAEVAAGRSGREALLAVIPALSAIAYAHSLGIVHRDLKPENLFIGSFGECTVLDWGLAIVLGEDPADQRGGSEGYASPEQRDGRAPMLDHDVYALGALLRFVMLGTHRAGPADRSLPPELRSIITKATSLSGLRYATAAELLADVQRYLAQGRVQAHAYSVRELIGRWVRRHRTATTALATAIVAATAVGAWSVTRIVDERDRAVAAEREGRVARDRTRELTAFLLGEVTHSVAELGRLDLATNLVTGLERHVSTAPSVAGDDEAIAEAIQQVELRGLMTDIALAKSDFDQALRHLAPVDAALARLPPHSAFTAHLRCEAALRTAQARRGKGDSSAARSALQACLAHIASVPPTVGERSPRFDTAHTAASAHVAMGDLQRDEGEVSAALASYRAAANAFAPAPETSDDRIEVARRVLRAAIEQRLGSLAQFQYQYADAEAHYRTALRHALAAVDRRENEASAQWLVAKLYVALAVAVGERGAIDEKRKLVEQAARIAEPLFAIDPTHDEHARWMTILWRAQAELGPADQAPALFARILDVSRRRAQLSPGSAVVLRDLAVDLTASATSLAESVRGEDRRRAQPLCEEALTVMLQRRRLLAVDTDDADVALTRIHCAEIAGAAGNRQLAQHLRTQTVEETRAFATRAHPGMLTAYATALATYLTDATAAEQKAQRAEMDRVWTELEAAKAEEIMAAMRDLAPWWQPKQN